MVDTVAQSEFSQGVRIRSILTQPDGGASLAGQTIKVYGWVKTGRKTGRAAAEEGKELSFAFVELDDGSCSANLQLMIYSDVATLDEVIRTGTCLHVEGVLQRPPIVNRTKQSIELKVSKVFHVGLVNDPKKYPLQKTHYPLEYLRGYVHLRPRTPTVSSAIARISSELEYATHTFFRNHGFLFVHTPIITSIDCEGAGDMFQVTTLINEAERTEKELIKNPPPSQEEVDMAKGVVKENGEMLGIPKKDGKVDYDQDFFARKAFLTVSGQLQAETLACALGHVYTFGPTFRAEHSHTSRHLAEFWMVEPEIACAEIEDDMKCAEAYVMFMCQWLLDNCLEDMKFFMAKYDKNAIKRLQMVASTNFVRLTYTDAVTILEEAVSKGHKFEKKVEWGIDLASEHEKYLTETKFESPVIVYNYPKGIKAFYMKLNPDKKTVAAMDVLVPKVGELIGGSQREENYEVLKERMLEMGLPLEPYEWYLDLRRYGTVKHSGFGLGFERMILFATGMDNIRDVIFSPRSAGKADL